MPANDKRAESVFTQWGPSMRLKVVNGGTFEIKQAVEGTTRTIPSGIPMFIV